MVDNVKNPSHYNRGPLHYACGKPIECINITEGHNFNRGNTIKYVWRADDKNNTLEDLKKARQYLDFEIDRLERFADWASGKYITGATISSDTITIGGVEAAVEMQGWNAQ